MSTSAAAATPSDCVLAQRFRPYIKMSKGAGAGEPYRPTNWDWVVSQSSLTQTVHVFLCQLANGQLTATAPYSTSHGLVCPQQGATPVDKAFTNTVMPASGWTAGYPELLSHNGDLTKYPGDSGLGLGVPSSIYAGESWNDVIHQGHGIYAHVEHISASQVNIEYDVLYAYNSPPGGLSQEHSGDLTTMIVQVDTDAQLISRVIYTAHGCLMQVDQMHAGQTASYGVVAGSDESSAPTETQVALVSADTANDHKGLCTAAFTASSDPHFYMAADPYTHVYQHPAVYIEVGDHEMWPNASGRLSFEGGHDGKGVSFVPDRIQVLGDVDAPAPGQANFLHYNGKFGSDPAAVALHNAWCWVASPQDRDSGPPCQVTGGSGIGPLGIPTSRFADMNPYRKIGSQAWPPPAYDAGATDVYVGPNNFGDAGVGTPQKPIPDFKLAYSVVAANRTLHIQAGLYGGNVILTKPMKLTAQGGPVTIGGGVGPAPAGTALSAEQACMVIP